MTNLIDELTKLLNRFSAENEANTPDFLLAHYLLACLEAFNNAVIARDQWYGIAPEPGKSDAGNSKRYDRGNR